MVTLHQVIDGLYSNQEMVCVSFRSKYDDAFKLEQFPFLEHKNH